LPDNSILITANMQS